MNCKSFTYLTKILIIFTFAGVVSCNKDDETSPPSSEEFDLSTFSGVIAQGNSFDPFPESRKTDVLKEASPVNDDIEVLKEDGSIDVQRFTCTTKTVSVLDGNGQFQLFDTSADVIYPGSLLQGKTLNDATPAPIVVKRAGGTISYNLNNGNLQSTFTVDEVKKSTIQDAMNSIIASSENIVPANFQLDIVQVESESQLALELGIDVKAFGAKVSSDMSFSTEKKFNRTLVKLNQSYYTMSFDLPTNTGEIFHESVTPEQLNNFIQPDNPGTFISSVTFGRIFFMLVESTSSRKEMQASLSTAFKGFGAKVESELEVNAIQSLKDLKIKVIAYGGDAEGSFELAGESSVEAIADKLAKSTNIRAGLPLSYVVRSIENPDQIVGTTLATEFDVTECELKGLLPSEGYQGLVDIFEDGIGAAANIKGNTIVVYNIAGNKYAFYDVGAGKVLGKFDLNDPNGPMGVSAFDKVGAIVKFEFGDNGLKDETFVFDHSGLRMQVLNYDAALINENELPSGPIGTYNPNVQEVSSFFTSGNSNFPFAANGIKAAVRLPNSVAFPFKNLLFASQGTEFIQTERNDTNNKIVNYPKQSSNSFPTQSGALFDKIGAAAKIDFGGNTEQILFINSTGDKMMYWEGKAKVNPGSNFELNNNTVEGNFSGIRLLK
ncbi:thiol-activated cytolysin family protein [Aquimarina sp. W85]|uniref:thiol-activated cytolysin family protein n=1 Tax=Aquimarina rhodophyticola TaxID=3342246 RepID=UPI0036731C65